MDSLRRVSRSRLTWVAVLALAAAAWMTWSDVRVFHGLVLPVIAL